MQTPKIFRKLYDRIVNRHRQLPNNDVMVVDDPIPDPKPVPVGPVTAKLIAASKDTTPEFGLSGLCTFGKALDVYDGDTLWLAFLLEGNVYRTRVRMYGYDSPEMKPKFDLPVREVHIQKAIDAKKRLEQLVSSGESGLVRVEFLRPDKYGRMLVKLFVANQCINDQMVTENHGYPYFGGTKQ